MTRTTPPPAANLVVLSADLLAVAVRKLLGELAFAATWEAGVKLRDALDTYESVRIGEIISDSGVYRAARETSNEPAPETQRSEVRS